MDILELLSKKTGQEIHACHDVPIYQTDEGHTNAKDKRQSDFAYTLRARDGQLKIASELLTEKCVQFILRLFVALCNMFKGTRITTTEYHPQPNSQSERFNFIPLLRLRHYLSKRQSFWDTYWLPLQYAYNEQVHRFMNLSSINLELTRTAPGSATVVPNVPL